METTGPAVGTAVKVGVTLTETQVDSRMVQLLLQLRWEVEEEMVMLQTAVAEEEL